MYDDCLSIFLIPHTAVDISDQLQKLKSSKKRSNEGSGNSNLLVLPFSLDSRSKNFPY